MSNIVSLQFPEDVRRSAGFELLEVMLLAVGQAWEEAIEPRMSAVRLGGIGAGSFKKGTDFFTEADVESERVIRECLAGRYGKDAFRVQGEESEGYTDSLDAEITVRIDPIDGTEAFKFGKANWSIMVGAYTGRGSRERQTLSVVYWPERYGQVLFSIADIGVFIGDVTTGSVQRMERPDAQDEIGNLLIAFHRHSNLPERGRDEEIVRELETLGARVRTLMPTEVKEAMETRGGRAIILDGDFNAVDFISYSSLVRLGYRVFTWDGAEPNVDDPDIADKKLLFVPPGKAGEIIREVVAKYVRPV